MIYFAGLPLPHAHTKMVVWVKIIFFVIFRHLPNIFPSVPYSHSFDALQGHCKYYNWKLRIIQSYVPFSTWVNSQIYSLIFSSIVSFPLPTTPEFTNALYVLWVPSSLLLEMLPRFYHSLDLMLNCESFIIIPYFGMAIVFTLVWCSNHMYIFIWCILFTNQVIENICSELLRPESCFFPRSSSLQCYFWTIHVQYWQYFIIVDWFYFESGLKIFIPVCFLWIHEGAKQIKLMISIVIVHITLSAH